MLDAAYRRAWRLSQLQAAMSAAMDRLASVEVDVPDDLAEDVAALIEETPKAWDAVVRDLARQRSDDKGNDEATP